jgi:hypothetical protein
MEIERLRIHGLLPVLPGHRIASPFPVLALGADDSRGATPHWACNTVDQLTRASPQVVDGTGGERLLSTGFDPAILGSTANIKETELVI